MGQLLYLTLASLDGYIEDGAGAFDWSAPDEEVHAFVNDLARSAGTFLYGRRMYETMAVWETYEGDTEAEDDFAKVWRAADKIVYSTTLTEPTTARTRVESRFDVEQVAALKEATPHELMIGGSELAADAFRAGLIDGCHLFLVPVSVGGGKPALPRDHRIDLALVDQRSFANGTVYLHYLVGARR
jgi:dihydrofolate reductase